MNTFKTLTSRFNSLIEKNFLWKRILSHIRKNSEKRRKEDISYIEENIDELCKVIQNLEIIVEENPYHLKALDFFADEKEEIRNPEVLHLIEIKYNSSYDYVMGNFPRFEKTVPKEIIEYYKETKKAFDELLKKVRSSYDYD